MNILIYFPYNLRTVEQQSVMEMLVNEGNNVYFLSTCERGYLHEFLESIGVKTYETKAAKGKLRSYFSNIKRLAAVIKENEIDVVIAHQQLPAFFAGLLRKVKRFSLIYVRHNSDEDYQLAPFKAKWLNKLTNALTPIKVAPSAIVEKFWLLNEKVAVTDIHRINYGYNFEQYEKPDIAEAAKIRAAFPARLLILSIARLAPTKRHFLMFDVVARLVNQGIDCKLICLGSGPNEEVLNKSIRELGMQEHIFLLGRKSNIFDYIEASDVFLHLSSSEASNSAVKEVGLLRKTVIVCSGVGDFDDYIISGENGFLVSKESPVEETCQILVSIFINKIKSLEIGERLFQTVNRKFAIYNIREAYNQILMLATGNQVKPKQDKLASTSSSI